MDFLGDQKGQGIIAMMFMVIMAFVTFYAWLVIYIPLYDDMIDPILDNVAYGSTIRILLQFMPLFVALAILAIPIMYFSGGGVPRQQY